MNAQMIVQLICCLEPTNIEIHPIGLPKTG